MRSVLLIVASLALFACGTPSIEGDPITYPSRRTQSTSDELETEDEDEPSAPKGVCAGEGSAKACFQCCVGEASEGALDVHTKALASCLCTETCATECAESLCKGNKADATCSACMNTATACDERAFAACDADVGCKSLLACADESKCATKK